MMMFGTQEKLTAIRREISYRRHVYARRITEGKMTKELADRQIGIFEDIAEDYRAKLTSERLL